MVLGPGVVSRFSIVPVLEPEPIILLVLLVEFAEVAAVEADEVGPLLWLTLLFVLSFLSPDRISLEELKKGKKIELVATKTAFFGLGKLDVVGIDFFCTVA